MNGRPGSALFLMEQLIAVAVFTVCAAVCAGIFTDAFLTAEAAGDLNNAMTAAKNGAEYFKLYSDAGLAAEALEGTAGESRGAVYYDAGWRVCGEDGAVYVMTMEEEAVTGPGPALCELSVSRLGGEEIAAFTVAGRGGAG